MHIGFTVHKSIAKVFTVSFLRPYSSYPDYIKGEIGTKVKLVIERDGKRLDFEITRQKIEVNPIKVNFIKKFQGQFYCNVLFEKIERKERSENNKPFIANLYINTKNPANLTIRFFNKNPYFWINFCYIKRSNCKCKNYAACFIERIKQRI